MIGKLEKLETCIRLADKMDNMDRTWRWFINPFFRMCNSKVKDLRYSPLSPMERRDGRMGQ